MSERPENPSDDQPNPSGGWHAPRDASPWQSTESQTQTAVQWRTVKALPDNTAGDWHLPDASDTTFSTEDEIEISDAPVTSPAPTAVAPNPEDLINEILSTGRGTTAPNPEDFVFPSRTADSEDAEEATVDADAMQSGDTLLVDEVDLAEPTEDEEAFSMSEYMALANMVQGDDGDLDGVDISSLSPADRIAFNIASETEREMERSQTEPPITDGDTVTMEDTSAQPASQAQDYAKQQLAKLQGDEGQDAFGAGQEQSFAVQEPEPQAQAPQYTQEEIQLAQQFRETKRQVGVLRQMQAQGQIDQSELQNQLQQYQILDPQGTWWMVGYETDEWYRYNSQLGDWEVAQPPVPLDAGQMRTETGLGEAAPNVLEGSLPYLPDDGTQNQEFTNTEPYDATQYSQAQQDYSAQFGDEYTPIPNPDQPAVDPNRTVVGDAWDKDSLGYAEPTLQNMNVVNDTTMPSDSYGGQQTIPSSSYTDNAYDNTYAEPYDPSVPAVGAQDAQEGTPTYDALVADRQQRTLFYVGIALFSLFIGGLLAVGGFIFWAQTTYSGIIAEWENEIAALGTANFDFQTATILANDGSVIYESISEEGARTIVSIEDGEVSPFFVHAVVSSEDPRFYENSGVDTFAIARAFFQNLMAGEVQSGASTITQQIVRDRVLSNADVSFDRKLTEALLALEVANRYSKNEILDIYINEFFYGENSYGVEAAANLYYNTTAADLNAAQSAMLAGILPSPSSTNPVVAPQRSFDNMRVVLDRMFETNCLNFQHGEWAATGQPFCVNENTLVDADGTQVPLTEINSDGTYGGFLALQLAQIEGRAYSPRETDIRYPHFVFYVLGQLDVAYGGGAYIERGFTIQTTIDPRIQDTAERVIEQQAAVLGTNGVQTGAAVVLDPVTGAVLSMVGSPDFFDVENEGQNNNVLSLQQPGSAIKPVVYATALEGTEFEYYTPATILWDVPSSYQIGSTVYSPTNFDGRYRGPVPVRIALAQSLNIPAVKTYDDFQVEAFLNVANAMGINFDPTPNDGIAPTFGLATALGATEVSLLDLTEAYGTIANDGLHVEPYVIESITERGPDGNQQTVPLAGALVPVQPTPAISPQTAFLLQNIMSDNNARTVTYNGVPSSFPVGSPIAGSALGLPNQNVVAVKTGTNTASTGGNPSRIWSVGFTNNYAVGVWFGTLNQGTPLAGRITGLTGASPAWNAIMQEALNGVSPGEFVIPSGVVVDEVCQLTGTLSDGSCVDRIQEFYVQSQPPPSAAEGYVTTIPIDTWTGLRANQWCPENTETGTFANIEDPFALSWLTSNLNGQSILTRLGLPTDLQQPPAQECQQGQTFPTVNINFPTENTQVTGDVVITGVINAQSLATWDLLITEVGTDNYRSILNNPRNDQVLQSGTQLTEWDSRQVQNGVYILRLEATSQSGGTLVRDVRITVQNTPPTPTPVPPTEVPVIITPIPFDLPTATPASP